MKKYKPACTLLTAMFLASLFVSCQKTNLVTPVSAITFRPAADFFKNNYEFTILYAAIKKAALADSLNGPGPFTIFAPTDNAFNLAGIHSAADINKMNGDSLKFLLKYHILNRKLFASDIPQAIDNLYPNADGLNLYITRPQVIPNSDQWNIPFAVNGDTVSNTNVIVTNGIVHVLTRVLNYNKGTVQDILAADTGFSYFVTGLKNFKLWDSLKTAGPFTVSAPSNEAFRRNGITLDSLNKFTAAAYDPALFKVYILYPHHIFNSDLNFFAPDENNGGIIPDGKYFFEFSVPLGHVSLSPFVLSLTPYSGHNAFFASPWAQHIDRVATNGVVNGLDNLLFFPSDALRK